MKLDEIRGNDQAKKVLEEAIRDSSFLHNYLFLGQDQEAKVQGAHILAQAILCQSEEGRPCGQCPSCRLYTSSKKSGENHPDLMEVFPSKTTSKESIKKASVVEIIQSTAMKSFEGEAKVFIIHNFETMTTEGQNALLKTLEDPLKGVHFILLAKAKDHILPTVLSRASQVYFDGMREEDIYKVLEEEGYSPDLIQRLVAYGAGSYPRALALARDPDLNQLRGQVFTMIHRVVTRPGYSALASWSLFEDHQEDLSNIFFFLESWARDIMVYYRSSSIEDLANRDFGLQIQEGAQALGDRAPQMMDIILRARQYLENNGNKQLIIEGMLLDIGGWNAKGSRTTSCDHNP